MKTERPKVSEITKRWYLIDAKGAILGRLATRVASILRGKDKVIFEPSIDVGDEVIVINAAQIKVTGNKLTQKVYSRYSAYPGGLKQTPLEVMLQKHPEEVIRHAVKGMLPKTKLGDAMLTKLRVYAKDVHPHSAQAPVTITLTPSKQKES